MDDRIFYSKDYIGSIRSPAGSRWFRGCAIILAFIAVIGSSFHFWPLEGSRSWEIFNPSNSSVMIWTAISAVFWFCNRKKYAIAPLLPSVSILAYLAVNVLSLMFAENRARSANFTVKLLLLMTGGYSLFSAAAFNRKTIKLLYQVIIMAVTICLLSCLATNYFDHLSRFGFFDNAHKFGTYTGTLVPFCAAFLIGGRKMPGKSLGIILAAAGILTAGSSGQIAAITIGCLTAAIISLKYERMASTLFVISLAAGFMLLFTGAYSANLKNDIKLTERNGKDLKQRYIEWQSEINLLSDRTVTGSGAGCINDHRSEYYFRLPKLNTLEAFDYNGFLVTAAETGFFGLVCFCWVILDYGKTAYRYLIKAGSTGAKEEYRYCLANFAGLISACIANIFCSIHNNGIIIVFVLLLALTSKANVLFEESPDVS